MGRITRRHKFGSEAMNAAAGRDLIKGHVGLGAEIITFDFDFETVNVPSYFFDYYLPS